MASRFSVTTNPARVVFGIGTIDQVRTEVDRLGRTRVLLVTDAHLGTVADTIRALLGELVVAQFRGAAMHTPVEVTDQALHVLLEARADCVVAVGGGSCTGLAKALAARTGVDQVVLPTTYAGSEVTPVLGETTAGIKTTRSGPEILPETVIYDVELSRSLPAAAAVTSAVNAMAHAAEALYSPQANPITDSLAVDAIGCLARGLRALTADPDDLIARTDLLRGAWLAGTCLGTVGMGLHHKLCHVLGGTFGLPHAQTHTVVLPHALAYNVTGAPAAMAKIAAALGADDAPTAVYDLILACGAPTSLRGLGLAESDLARVAELASQSQYPNPVPVERDGVASLLASAWAGSRPSSTGGSVADFGTPTAIPGATAIPGVAAIPGAAAITAQVLESFSHTGDARLRQLLFDLVPRLHEFATHNDLTQDEWQFGIEFLTRTGQWCSDIRQECVLLSDTLGLSSVVDLITNSRTPDTTASAVLGPFYVEGPPELAQGADAAAGLPGTPLFVDVRITGTDHRAVAGAVVDIWQSNDDGFYDVQLPDFDGPVLRGRFRADDDGRLRFRSILPSEYPIPTDGTVGSMLAATGRHPYRAPHLHFMIQAPGYRKLITQLFVAGGKYLDSDAVFGVKDSLVIDYVSHTGPTPDGSVIEGEWRSLDFTFTIAAAAV